MTEQLAIRFPGGDEAVRPYVEQLMGVKAGEKFNPHHGDSGRFASAGGGGGGGRDRLDSEIAKVHSELRGQPTESVIALNSSGERVFTTGGTRNEVLLPNTPDPRLKGSVMIHNHPIMDKTFSDSDIEDGAFHGVHEVQAVTDTRVFSMKAPEGKNLVDKKVTWTSASGNRYTSTGVRKHIRQYYEKHQSEYKRLLKERGKQAAANEMDHRGWKYVADKMGWEYSVRET